MVVRISQNFLEKPVVCNLHVRSTNCRAVLCVSEMKDQAETLYR